MGLYKICEHKGRMRDRCEHAWWDSFRGVRVSLPKWANRDIHTKADAQAVLDEVGTAVRQGTFDPRGQAPREVSPMTLRELGEVYKERHAVAKKLSLARTIDWRIRPILERFGDWALTEIKTADIEDFIADLGKPRIVGKHAEERCLTLPHFHDAWLRTVLKAHGIKPRWTGRLKYKGLSSESKAAFRKMDLHWHDLRQEYASRLVEKGVPLAQVRDLLGHASITTTERYDNQTVEALRAAAARLEAGKAFQPSETGHFQDSFKRVAEGDQVDHTAIEPNELENLDLADWLGVRDDFRNWLVTAA